MLWSPSTADVQITVSYRHPWPIPGRDADIIQIVGHQPVRPPTHSGGIRTLEFVELPDHEARFTRARLEMLAGVKVQLS